MKDLTEILEQHLPKDVWLYTEVPYKLEAAIVAWAEGCVPEKKGIKELFPSVDTEGRDRDVAGAVVAKNMYNLAIDQTLTNIRKDQKVN